MKNDKDYLNRLSKSIRFFRISNKWNQVDLANKAGISRNTLVELEGGGNPSFTTLIKVLGALGKLRVLDPLLQNGEKKELVVINGPNLNLIGKREPKLYGTRDLKSYLEQLRSDFFQFNFDFFQSNIEGELVDKIQSCAETADYIFLNAGAYTHTSLAIADAVKATDTPTLELHISNVMDREEIRHLSLISKNCRGVISGFGLPVYRLACQHVLSEI